MVSYDLPNLLLRRTGKPFRGRNAATRVHAHVERRVVAETETAGRVVELGRGDAEIEQDAVGTGDSRPRRQFGQPAEPAMQHAKPRVINLLSRRYRLRVTIQRQQP